MNLICVSCKKERSFNNKRESVENYQKRRPYCISCGHKNRIKTLGGHGPTYRAARVVDSKGYVRVWTKAGYVKEHRHLYEQAYGPIPFGFVIHHIDGNKQNNSLDNLECLSKLDHDRMNPSIRTAWMYRWRKGEV